ncbi:DUF4157 domain-containing protein [Azotobacter chroococcum]|uniref:eCIS core domain-containing protein n=1 Tax=Azotobacter chroococcum TaxID=353 RepID=UPI00103A860A|nr:DUF4157 domain-containing protein [Azotobacter chroococcum]TBW39880.1 DUF4157 domain-containing protein [Azotobacter chroococcum]
MSTAAPLRSQPAKSQPTSNASHASLLLQRKCACGSPTASLTGECEECASKKRLQTKLTIGASNDPLELEADRVADQVMARPAHAALSGASPCIRRFSGQQDGLMEAPPSVGRALASLGQPLEPALRQDMEQRFGYDFSQVRIHTGMQAAESAASVDALAYTVGNHVVFGANKFVPSTTAGSQLLAHELAHVVQQSNSVPRFISRKPTRSRVKSSEFSFSTNCGWIDWGHAMPGFAQELIARVQQASDALKTGGTGTGLSPRMTAKKYGIIFSSASMEIVLARPLTADEVLAVSLSILKNVSMIFETQQEWTDWFSGSAFSQEDLPSNLIGFYRATNSRGFTIDQIKQYCDAQDVDTSLKEFDKPSDFQKNRTFSPIGSTGTWPAELSTIDDSKGASLYKVTNVSVAGPTSGFTFCPLYRLVGTIGETDLIVASLGGATFSSAENVRVVPTYRVDPDRVSGAGHVPFIEVQPYEQSDADVLKAKGIKTPLYVPSSALKCIGGMAGSTMSGHLMRQPEASMPTGNSRLQRKPARSNYINDYDRPPAYPQVRVCFDNAAQQSASFGIATAQGIASSGNGRDELAPPAPEAGKCRVGRSESKCVDGIGHMITKIDNDCCTRPCTVEHETQHVRDLDECCKAYHRARKAPGANKDSIDAAGTSWMNVARNVSECRAYSNDLTCAQRLAVEKGCIPEPKRGGVASEIASSDGDASDESMAASNGISGATAQDVGSNAAVSSVLREQSDCCNAIQDYAEMFAPEMKWWCGLAAGKSIPPCPFPSKPKQP